MDAAWEAGITTFDTADAYGGGRSESFIGSWLRSKGADVRDRIVLTTKTFNPMSDGADRGLAPRADPAAARRRASSGSASSAVDLYLAHAMDPDVPVAGDDRRLRRARRRGHDPAPTAAATSTRPGSRRRSRHGSPAWVQNSYSLLDRDDETACSRSCAREGLGYTPFSPLAGGWLTGKYRRGEEPPAGSRMTLRPEPYRALPGRARLRRARGVRGDRARARDDARPALAIAWLLGEPHVTRGRRRPAPPRAARARARGARRCDLSPPEREQLAALFA